jgi:hypothetical protein
VEAGEEQQPMPAADGIGHAMDGRHFARAAPVVGHRQPLAPCAAGVRAALHYDPAFAVPLGVHGQHTAAITEQRRGDVAEVLPGLTVNDDESRGVAREVEHGDAEGVLSGEGCRQEEAACEREEMTHGAWQ